MTNPSDLCRTCSLPIEAGFKPRAESRVGLCRKCGRRAQNAAFMARYREANREEVNAAQRAYKAAHPDRIVKYRADWSARHRELKRERGRRFQEENKERLAADAARRYAESPERVRAKAKAWRLANPERYRELKQRRRARVRDSTIGPIDVDALWTGLCGICAQVIDPTLRRPDPMSRSIDHIMPLSRGGSHTQDNLRWTHLVCNLRKGSKVPKPD